VIDLNELLDDLELGHLEPAASDRVDPAPDHDGETGTMASVTLAALLASAAASSPVPAGSAGVDWSVRAAVDAPNLLLVSRTERAAIARVRCNQSGAHWEQSPDGVALELTPARGFVIEDVSGKRLAVRLDDGGGCHLNLLVDPAERPTELEPGGAVEAPLESWLSDAPRWLVDEIEDMNFGTYGAAAAAGLYLRVAEPEDPAAVRDAVARLLAGEPDPVNARVDAWLSGLSSAQVGTVAELGLAEVAQLQAELDDLERAPAPGASPWRARLLRLLLRRDDLAGVLELLGRRGEGGALADAMAAFDVTAVRWLRSLPFEVQVRHARLWRVRQAAPDAWWAAPARP